MGKVYNMKKEMYEGIKYPMYWDGKEKKMKKSKKGISHKEILQYINQTFDLKDEVVEINFI